MGFMATEQNAPIVSLSANIGNQVHNWQGRIVRTSAAIDQETRLIYAVAEVIDPYGQGSDANTALAVGMYVSAHVDSNYSQDTLQIPRLALHNNDKVYVINDESKLEIRQVNVLSTNKDTVHIASGIAAGEKVVTSTVPVVVDGMEVKALVRETTEQAQG
jgi:multidrug efflux pump subunit AcrA (membrane-fusion protein)